MDAEQLACTPEEIKELREIARSTHAGYGGSNGLRLYWGAIEGRTVQELVLDVRVVPESIKKCLQQFRFEKRLRLSNIDWLRWSLNREVRLASRVLYGVHLLHLKSAPIFRAAGSKSP